MDFSTGAGVLGLILIIVGAIILSILPIILFFKIWRMTNDIKYMSQMMVTLMARQDRQNELLKKIADNTASKTPDSQL